METLLSLTSRKAGDWFKEELRTLGGLDHIVNTGDLLSMSCFVLVITFAFSFSEIHCGGY
jgi:hypothetical protein